MRTVLDLLAFVEECGSLEAAALKLKVGAVRIGNSVLGLAPMPPSLVRDTLLPPSPGKALLEAYMKLTETDFEEAATLLDVTPGYLAQQLRMKHPTGAVRREMQRQIDEASPDAVAHRENAMALLETARQRAAERAAAPQSRPMSAAEIREHNARVLAERQARK